MGRARAGGTGLRLKSSTTQNIVVLLGGASGVGKSQLGHALARHLDAALVEVDDLVVAVQALTAATEQPAVHHWLQHDSSAMPISEVVERQVDFAVAMQPAVAAVVKNHLSTRTPVVIEGDYIVPVPPADPAVRAALIVEDDVEQLVANYLAREPELGPQRDRARAGIAYGRWLTNRAQTVGIPVVPARPWPTAFDRLVQALQI